MVVSNVLAAVGVVCVLVAVAQLANVWWALLILGVVLMAASYGSFRAASAPPSAPKPAAAAVGEVS